MRNSRIHVRLLVFAFIAGLCVTFAFIEMSYSPGSDTDPHSLQNATRAQETDSITPPHFVEISNLRSQLRNRDCDVQSKAYGRLQGFGTSVVGVWQLGQAFDNAEALRLECKLLAEIQARNGIQSVFAKGLEFRGSVPSVWEIPPPGSKSSIKLKLSMTNHHKSKVHGRPSIGFHIVSFEGRQFEINRGSDGFTFNFQSPILEQGQSFSVSDFRACLCRSKEGNEMKLEGRNVPGFFSCTGLAPGFYYFWFSCRCDGSRCDILADNLDPSSIVSLPPVVVQIK